MATRDARGEWVGSEFDAASTAERGLCLLAMTGAVVGAFAGSVLAADTAGVIPAVCGAVGAVGGSALAAAAWSALTGRSHHS